MFGRSPQDPKDFDSLIGAGRAALELGDAQAAAGFFARADEVNPRSPLPQEGMGAVSVANGDAAGGDALFHPRPAARRAASAFGCHRGLAYDLLGQQAKAQTDYRAALSGRDATRPAAGWRSVSPSVATAPARSDVGAALREGRPRRRRVRAFVLALTGDPNAAITCDQRRDAGSSAGVAPFLQRLPVAPAGQKAAAVNLGIVPDADIPLMLSAPSGPSRRNSVSRPPCRNRRSARRAAACGAAGPTRRSPSHRRSAAVPVLAPPPPRARTRCGQPKIWLQLASGQNATTCRRFSG